MEIAGVSPQAMYERSRSALQVNDFATAIEWADRLCAVGGADPQVLGWAAQVRLSAGLPVEAIALAKQSIARSPSPQIFALLGHAYEAIGDDEHAETAFRSAIDSEPNNALWIYHRAGALLRLGRGFEALELFRRGAALLPNPACSLRQAELELTFGHPAAALEAANRAITLESGDPMGYSIAARALDALNRPDEAEARWTEASLAAGPDSRKMEILRAQSLAEQGRFTEGVACAKQLIERYPDWPDGYQFVTVHKVTEAERPLMAQAKRLLDSDGLSDEQRSALNYALGKSHADLREFETAIRYYNEANRLKFEGPGPHRAFHPDAYAADISRRIEAYSARKMERTRRGGFDSPIPIFVVGMIRSGTTLAEQILSSHPHVGGAGELTHWINVDDQLIDTAGRLAEDRLWEAGKVYLRIVKSFVGNGVTRVVDKQPGNLLLAGALHTAFPNARILYLTRQPIDTALSIWTTPTKTSATFVHKKANIVCASWAHDRLKEHWKSAIPADRFMEVSYEGLVQDRETVTRSMLEFCGLPWNEACLTPESNAKVVGTPSMWQVRQPVYRTSIDRWRDYEPWLEEFRELLSPLKGPA